MIDLLDSRAPLFNQKIKFLLKRNLDEKQDLEKRSIFGLMWKITRIQS
jgi:hypothetical protein